MKKKWRTSHAIRATRLPGGQLLALSGRTCRPSLALQSHRWWIPIYYARKSRVAKFASRVNRVVCGDPKQYYKPLWDFVRLLNCDCPVHRCTSAAPWFTPDVSVSSRTVRLSLNVFEIRTPMVLAESSSHVIRFNIHNIGVQFLTRERRRSAIFQSVCDNVLTTCKSSQQWYSYIIFELKWNSVSHKIQASETNPFPSNNELADDYVRNTVANKI